MSTSTVEIIGYLGSILVAVSLMMRSLLRLRLINLVGALFFTAYGLLLRAYPVAFLNGLIVAIDIYYLVQMWRQKDFFSFLEVSPESAYLRAFVTFYQDDIQAIIPSYAHRPEPGLLCFFVLRNLVPAGLFVARLAGSEAHIQLDYVIPNYRDFQVARFIFEENAAVFRARGIHRFVSTGGSPLHRRYLRKLGFVEGPSDQFARELRRPVLHDQDF